MRSKESKKNEREVIKSSGGNFIVVGKTGQGKNFCSAGCNGKSYTLKKL